jgi:hypothetical protein
MKREGKRRADIPVRHGVGEAGWKTRPPFIEAEARETDKARKEILEKLGV